MRISVWSVTHKGDPRGRALADKHYTRQSPGHPMWTRPGYNYVLIADGAVFVWWRPKWEAGIERKDGLRAIECTIFRRESPDLPKSSEMIRAAVAALTWPEARAELRLDACGSVPDGLITGVGVSATAARRSRHSPPGACFRAAGWRELKGKQSRRAQAWLHHPFP